MTVARLPTGSGRHAAPFTTDRPSSAGGREVAVPAWVAIDQPREVLAWALDLWGERLLVTTALGAGGVLLLHYLHELAPDHPAWLIDTGQLFDETLAYRDYLVAAHGFRIQTLGPALDEPAFAAAHGDALWETDPDRCCSLRKVEPVQHLLAGRAAWISALRREQGGLRATLPVARRDASGVVRVYPLLLATRASIDAELARLGILQHPLRDRGFPSVGCRPCTSPACSAAGSERAGRWTGTGKTECGLHFPTSDSRTETDDEPTDR